MISLSHDNHSSGHTTLVGNGGPDSDVLCFTPVVLLSGDQEKHLVISKRWVVYPKILLK